jgi:hypothetical protein
MSYDPTNAERPDRTGLLSAAELAQGNENATQNGVNATLLIDGVPVSPTNPLPVSGG